MAERRRTHRGQRTPEPRDSKLDMCPDYSSISQASATSSVVTAPCPGRLGHVPHAKIMPLGSWAALCGLLATQGLHPPDRPRPNASQFSARPDRRFAVCYHRAVQGSAGLVQHSQHSQHSEHSEHGGQRPVSRRDVLKYACAPALLSLGAVAANLGERKAAAADMQLIDFAEKRIPPDRIKSAGYDGVVNYVSESRPGANFEAKPITREYADALRAAGLHIVSNFQYGKPGGSAPSDFTRGYDGGVTDAQTALALHTAAGGPATAPIFFSVDEPLDANAWKTLAAPVPRHSGELHWASHPKPMTWCWPWAGRR